MGDRCNKINLPFRTEGDEFSELFTREGDGEVCKIKQISRFMDLRDNWEEQGNGAEAKDQR